MFLVRACGRWKTSALLESIALELLESIKPLDRIESANIETPRGRKQCNNMKWDTNIHTCTQHSRTCMGWASAPWGDCPSPLSSPAHHSRPGCEASLGPGTCKYFFSACECTVQVKHHMWFHVGILLHYIHYVIFYHIICSLIC